jgi:redox-sensitive bicupin YhaK (pirin superfamily)
MQVSRDALHAAYVYQSGVTSSLVVDGQEGRAWTKILRYAISDDGRHVAYVAQDEKSYVLVVDGQAGEKFEFIESQSLLFHGRTGRVLCAAENGQGHFLLVDGKVLGPYDSLGLVGFSDSGDSYAAVAALRPNIHCIVNGRESEAFQSISARVVFSPDGLSTPFR